MFLDINEPPLGTYAVYTLDSGILHSAGARVMVHAPNTMPVPVDYGQDVAPGFSTSISIKPYLHARLPHPYGNCSDTRLRGLPRCVALPSPLGFLLLEEQRRLGP